MNTCLSQYLEGESGEAEEKKSVILYIYTAQDGQDWFPIVTAD